jgi:ABC-type branched-subunit amino acid transport system substrate-binding protein
MKPRASISRLSAHALVVSMLAASPTLAEKKYGPGVTDTEIKIGQTMPYSGPASLYSTAGKAMVAYFDKVNADGGVNGRKIKLISLDDGYSPPRTMEQTRKLVEQEEVLLIFGTLGTAVNTAIHKYLNTKRVPQLLISSIGMKWNDPQNFPWTIAFQPNQKSEGGAYARYLLKNHPNAKIAILYQNDDFGGGYLQPVKEALGERAGKMIVGEASYEVTDASVDSQIVSLQASGADTLLIFASPKFAAMAIRKAYDTGWKPLELMTLASATVASVLQPAGLEKSVGVISSGFLKDPTDPHWKNDASTKGWVAWMKRYYPDGNTTDVYNVVGYTEAQAMVEILKHCGDDLTRENVMKQAASLKNLELPMFLPGIKITTSPTDYRVIKQLQLMRFDGKQWILFGDVVGE